MTDFGVGTYTRNVVRALGRIDLDRENVIAPIPAAALAPWFVVAGLGLVGLAVLIA